GIAPDLVGHACPAAYGVIPYATLGLSREIAEDGWGNLFSYHVYAEVPTPTCPGPGLNWGNSQCFGEGKGGALKVNDGPNEIANSVVAVVVSHGPNGLGAYGVLGTPNPDPT